MNNEKCPICGGASAWITNDAITQWTDFSTYTITWFVGCRRCGWRNWRVKEQTERLWEGEG